MTEFNRIALTDMDGVIVTTNSNIVAATELGQKDLAIHLEEERKANRINTAEYNARIARIYRGLTPSEIEALWEKLPIINDVRKTTALLIKLGIVPVVLTSGLGDFARICRGKYGFLDDFGADLIYHDGRATGNRNRCVEPEDKIEYAWEICDAMGIGTSKLIAIEDGKSGLPLFRFVREAGGTTFAFNDYERQLAEHATYNVASDSLYTVASLLVGD